MFSTVFYSKTIGKQKKLSHYVNPDDSRSETWHNAFSYIVDRNCKVSLETYFAFLNLKTRRPTKVVDLTVLVFANEFLQRKTRFRYMLPNYPQRGTRL